MCMWLHNKLPKPSLFIMLFKIQEKFAVVRGYYIFSIYQVCFLRTENVCRTLI